MDLDISGLSPEEVEDLMQRIARIGQKSDVRRAQTGDPGRTVSIGFDVIAGRVVYRDIPPREKRIPER